MKHTPFVRRDIELETLDSQLLAAMRGEKHLMFIAGEAGMGKTWLVKEFCQRAEQRYDDLIVASSACSTVIEDTISAPYQPFKDIFRVLTSGSDEQVSGPAATDESGRRVQRVCRQVAETVMELGPGLVGLFVPAAGLITAAGVYLADRKGWVRHLKAQSEPTAADLSQDLIFEQVSRVVLELASQFPLLLVLDDLQWADYASLNLLFHLARRVSTEKLLIVGLYRTTGVQRAQSGEDHRLVRVLNELRRYFGDIVIDLDGQSELEGRAFVDAVLDSEPNALDDGFRVWLFRHTRGTAIVHR